MNKSIFLILLLVPLSGYSERGAYASKEESEAMRKQLTAGLRIQCENNNRVYKNDSDYLKDDDIKELMAKTRLWTEEVYAVLSGKNSELKTIQSATRQFAETPCENHSGLFVYNAIERTIIMLSIQPQANTDSSLQALILRGATYRDKLFIHLLIVAQASDGYIGMTRAKQLKQN